MTGPDDFELDEAALKSAVRRACARQAAPPELRRRVESLMSGGVAAAAASSKARPAPRSGRRWPAWAGSAPWKTFAAAACCLIAVGIAALQIWNAVGDSSPHYAAAERVAFPVSVSAEMIATHDNCAKRPDHHLIPGNDPAAVLAQLAQGSVPPSIPAFTAPANWQFKGGALCPVGDTKAAHLLFTNGKETVSIFFLGAPSTCSHGNSALYREVVNGHAVEAFVYAGSVYGVVGTSANGGPAALVDLDPLITQVGSCAGATHCGGLEFPTAISSPASHATSPAAP